MASEPVPSPDRSPRRAPRGVEHLPVHATHPSEVKSPTADLADFKPKRRKPAQEAAPAPTAPLAPRAVRADAESPAPRPRSRKSTTLARRLIVNADDFGRSHSINQAVIRAHRDGILTTASLMVAGDAVEEAVELAKQNPTLGVGLHLTLVCGKAAAGRMEIPDLVNPAGEFTNSPVAAGTRYFFHRRLRLQLAREINAQFVKFQRTGLPLDHVNGHLNIHLHPTVLNLLLSRHLEWGIRHLRVTDDPYLLNRRLADGAWFYRASHAVIFRRLARRARPLLARCGIRCTDRVFGLLQNARVDERFITRLLPVLPRGDSELYSHPSLDEFRHEFEALISPRVKALVTEQGIELIRYQDL